MNAADEEKVISTALAAMHNVVASELGCDVIMVLVARPLRSTNTYVLGNTTQAPQILAEAVEQTKMAEQPAHGGMQ